MKPPHLIRGSFCKAGRLLQVGHIERFNPAFRELTKVVANEEVVVLGSAASQPALRSGQ